jgi:DNA-binding transcriptional LysR family regulator
MSQTPPEPEVGALLDSVDDLRAFVDVVDAGSFTAAARLRGVSTKWVSRRVARLEERLGVAVLERTTRRVALSETGARLYPHAREALRALDAAEDAVRPQPGQVVVHLAVPGALAGGAWMRALQGLQAQQPGLRVVLRAAEEALDLVAEGLDAQIVAHPPPWPTVRVRRLGPVARELWAAPEIEAPDREVLRRTPAVLAPGARGWLLSGPDGPVEIEPPCRLHVAGDGWLYAAVSAGAGVGALPPGPHPGLRRVLPGCTVDETVLYAITPRAGRRSLTVEAVLALPVSG